MTLDRPLYKLVLEHADLCRWLNLPGAELWAEQYAVKSARLVELWTEIQRRRGVIRDAGFHEKLGVNRELGVSLPSASTALAPLRGRATLRCPEQSRSSTDARRKRA